MEHEAASGDGELTGGTRVKVCGLTNLPDAELALGAGAWAIGMIFYAPSPRSCSFEQARLICSRLRRRLELCGVFVNAPLEQAVSISEALGLDLAQLHGDEGPAYCAELKRRTGVRVIKARQVLSAGDVRELERYHVDFHLLDARARARGAQQLRGGTGESFDWSLARARRSGVPMILSGGLTAANVSRAIATARPFAVDSASGTESAPGRKDPARLAEFVAAARAAPRHARIGQPA